MIASFLITFRETLEAALVVGIILAYLVRTKNTRYNNVVYIGVGAGIAGSIIAAILFNILAGGFSGKAEEIFEGATMLFGAFLLTTVILWMMRQRNVAHALRKRVDNSIQKKSMAGLFFLAFVSVLREGVETVLFLGAANLVSQDRNFTGGILGISSAVFLGYLIFVASARIDIKRFFNLSSFLLLLFAAGLVGHGVHELEEAGILNPLVEHVWDINPPASRAGEGIYPALHENGVIGSMAKGLFGYNGNPSLLEVISYFGYLGLIFFLFARIQRKAVASGQL